MQEYSINVTQVEEWQMIKDTNELDKVFSRAERILVGGGVVRLVRQQANGHKEKFDEFSTLEDLAQYKKQVYKYM